jgi:hypothetical protein
LPGAAAQSSGVSFSVLNFSISFWKQSGQ